jgi:hypothetical protein
MHSTRRVLTKHATWPSVLWAATQSSPAVSRSSLWAGPTEKAMPRTADASPGRGLSTGRHARHGRHARAAVPHREEIHLRFD